MSIHKLYDETVIVEFRGGVRHTYKVDGQVTSGVTSILNTLAKPDLLGWAAWEATEAFKTAVKPFTLAGASCTQTELKKLADEAKKAYIRKSDKGKDVGTIAHEWIKQETEEGVGTVRQPKYVLDLLDSAKSEEERSLVTANAKAALHPIKLWRQWLKDYEVEIIKSEAVVYSRELNYCGTMDVMFYSKRLDKVFIGDYKTSEPQKIRNSKYQITGYRAYPEHFGQCAAYDHAHHEEFQIDPDGYAIIYLPKDPDSSYHFFPRESVELDRLGWKNLVGTYRWIQLVKKG